MRLFKNIVITVCLLILVSGVDKTTERSDQRSAINVRSVSFQVTNISAAPTSEIQLSESQSNPTNLKTYIISKTEKSENPAEFIPQIRRFGFTN